VGIDRFKPTRAQVETVGQTDVRFSQGTGRIITRPLSYALFKVIAGFVSLGRIAAKKTRGLESDSYLACKRERRFCVGLSTATSVHANDKLHLTPKNANL
jgi:hypothetical protein